MNHVTDTRRELAEIYKGLKDGSLDLHRASEMNNTIGKFLSTYKLELAKCALTGEKPEISFLDSTPRLKDNAAR